MTSLRVVESPVERAPMVCSAASRFAARTVSCVSALLLALLVPLLVLAAALAPPLLPLPPSTTGFLLGPRHKKHLYPLIFSIYPVITFDTF